VSVLAESRIRVVVFEKKVKREDLLSGEFG